MYSVFFFTSMKRVFFFSILFTFCCFYFINGVLVILVFKRFLEMIVFSRKKEAT